MPKMTVELGLEEIKESFSQLSPSEIKELIKGLQERLQTQSMMELAESGFSEWENPEEDIYYE